ncbi:hypothetical protein [Paenibacillus polymyxa]|uniref:hypothetical protein n=1 Tax=Paenibacillus polymyxa TaxID=1406 RepID=UPI002023CE5B|nr:hypothetical protein [Paenibacillus polymyxa]URJ61481.1 hypothetical protein MF622_001213 [Paenibacillus polymyxa]
MAALTEAQMRICAHACITRYERGEGDIANIMGSYALDEKQREQVMEIVSKHSNLVQGNVDDLSSTDAPNEQEETVKWYNSIFRKKTV